MHAAHSPIFYLPINQISVFATNVLPLQYFPVYNMYLNVCASITSTCAVFNIVHACI